MLSEIIHRSQLGRERRVGVGGCQDWQWVKVERR